MLGGVRISVVDGELPPFGGQAEEDGGIVLSMLVTQQPPGPCPDFFLVGSSQLTLSESTQVDEHIHM